MTCLDSQMNVCVANVLWEQIQMYRDLCQISLTGLLCSYIRMESDWEGNAGRQVPTVNNRANFERIWSTAAIARINSHQFKIPLVSTEFSKQRSQHISDHLFVNISNLTHELMGNYLFHASDSTSVIVPRSQFGLVFSRILFSCQGCIASVKQIQEGTWINTMILIWQRYGWLGTPNLTLIIVKQS